MDSMTTAPIKVDTSSDVFKSVFDVVRRALVDSLAIDSESVKLDSRLIDDLGADSLDFVDIVFTLDRELDIRVRESEFNFITRLDFSSPEVMKDGVLTSAVIERLETWLPALRAVPDKTTVTPRELFSLITVEAICIVATQRVEARGAGAPSGGEDPDRS